MNKIITIIRESRLARFLIPAGLMLTVFGVFFFVINSKNQDYIKTEATVTRVELEQEAYTDTSGNRVEATYLIGLKYNVNGQDYESELGGLSKLNVGEKMTIYYNPADPVQITQTTSLILPVILIAAGIAALVGGAVSISNAAKKLKRMNEQEKEWANG